MGKKHGFKMELMQKKNKNKSYRNHVRNHTNEKNILDQLTSLMKSEVFTAFAANEEDKTDAEVNTTIIKAFQNNSSINETYSTMENSHKINFHKDVLTTNTTAGKSIGTTSFIDNITKIK